MTMMFKGLEKSFLWSVAVSALLLVTSCSDGPSSASSDGSKVEFSTDSLSGMMRVNAKQALVTLGTDESSAKSNERPQMKVFIDYDFSMGKHEVTCGEFNSLMKKATGLVLDCSNDSLPATDLTYYDAVLFANARSKAEKFDTAYTYNKASFDADKHCTNLDGFTFHTDVDAYRLPTEAEWTLVAQKYWKPSEAWTADNSDYKSHKVCSKAKSKDGVCDMVGNAMEWVNDWLGNFRDTSLTNYVGAPDGGAMDQRIVKGGSFRNSTESIHIYNRGDIYSVTSSTRANYVGFRLAYGAISDATWMGSDGKASTNRMVLLASSATMRSLLGSHRAKLVFRNGYTNNLAYVDYSNGILSVTEINDSLDAYHPDISPDGKKVAFCTRYEGLSGKSELYVRDLNAEGSNLVKLDVENAVIPRWRVLENGDTVIVYVTDAGNNEKDDKFKAASTWQVKFAKGKFGKPEKLFDGAYHGGISEDRTLAVSGARRLRARIAKSGSTVTGKASDEFWYNSEQACNVSLAGDSSKRTVFLDFGSETGKAFVGSKYRAHEHLFIADSTGKLIQSVAAPDGFTFDHTEWVLNYKSSEEKGGFIVASLANANGALLKIVLVNLSDGKITELVEGEDLLWHPCLWVNDGAAAYNGGSLDLDSAGVYFTPEGGEAAIFLRYKLELLWKYKDSANVIIVGSSRCLNGIDPRAIEKPLFAINLANVPNMMVGSEYLLTNYVIPHTKNLKYIVISLDIDLWYHPESESSYNFFLSEYENYPGYVYDRNHNFWKDGFPEELARLTEESLGNDYFRQHLTDAMGYNGEDPNSWETKPAVDYDSTWMSSRSSNYYASFGHLKNILQEAENQGIYVVGVVFPQSPNFKKTGSFGRYGIRRSEAPALLAELENLQQEYPHFVFWDENKMGDHDYTDEMATNRDHLSTLGAAKFTSRLDSLLKNMR